MVAHRRAGLYRTRPHRARTNGHLRTDHGTGGAAFLAGGAVQGGRVQRAVALAFPGSGPMAQKIGLLRQSV
ncbi:hypothetical protein [Falsiroseomonas sp. E2-1-a4]|uniref:hypothetical protein n=1 Tax=Falsiroseomonas sp. E2-1-a4 TaxID=3239299 RepID=UPI003F3364FC